MASLLDNDLYQLTMSQLAWLHHRERSVRFRFRNRTFSVRLGDALDLHVLRERLGEVVTAQFSDGDVEVARGFGLLGEPYLQAMASFRLPGIEVDSRDGHLELTYEGPWHEAIFLETPVLATVSELYQEQLGAGAVEGERRLDAKVRHLAANPQLRFMEFGTRRRASGPWQRHVLHRLVAEVPASVLGTSNVALAAELGIPALGTMAHQLFMVAAALELAAGGDLGASEAGVLDRWEALYPSLRTLLPDTFTTPFALPRLDRFAGWPGVRVDSGDPMVIGELVLDWWRRNGEDPAAHGLVFSDALDLRDMSVLHDAFGDRVGVTFGWGTNLTNDLGFEPLSLVIKPDAVDGVPCVKLSDDLAKATGPRDEVERYTRLVRG
ncbi:MAG: pncB [Actinomycetia bacterium]|nr:pncB [Actinomycetes bacterium]